MEPESEPQSLEDLAAGLLTEPQVPSSAVNEKLAAGEPQAVAEPQEPQAPEIREPEPEPEPESELVEGEELVPEPEYPLQVGDKEVRVTLKDALEGYRKSLTTLTEREQLTAAQQNFMAEVTAVRAQREHYDAALAEIQSRLGPSNGEPTADQWNALRQADPARYATEWTDYQRREMHRGAVRKEQDRLAGERYQEQVQRLSGHIENERSRLFKALPSLADPVKRTSELQALRNYAATLGYSEAEMDQAYDHRMIVAVAKARQWDNHLAALNAAKSKVANAPAIAPPSGRQPQKSGKAAAREAAQKRFNETGRIEDAVTLLIQ